MRGVLAFTYVLYYIFIYNFHKDLHIIIVIFHAYDFFRSIKILFQLINYLYKLF